MASNSSLRALTRLDGSVGSLLEATLEILPRCKNEVWATAASYCAGAGSARVDAMAARGASVELLSASFKRATAESPPPLLVQDNDLTSISAARSWTQEMRQAIASAGCVEFEGTIVALKADQFVAFGYGMDCQTPTLAYRSPLHASLKPLLRVNLLIRRAVCGLSPLDAADTVLHPNGTLLHCARADLTKRAVRSGLIELVRARESDNAFEALSSTQARQHWEELATGGYAFLDYVDTDGRRYILAFRVAEPIRPVFALAPDEKHILESMLRGRSNKVIGHELKLSSPSVSDKASRALHKLGARSLTELSKVLRCRRSLVFCEWQLDGERLAALGFDEAITADLAALTASEREVLQGLLAGRTQREIALWRGVALRTVANQIAAIYRTLGVSGRRELMAKLAAD